ncbi:MAG: ABC transporter permease [Chloroflexi bacterium]|nr:ABC transporter permease [Chloroflexota bacterium]
MNVAIAAATGRRVLTQLRHDPRTLALLLVVPVVLMLLMKTVFWNQDGVFQRVGPPLLGIFPLTSMFLVTSVAMLRERTSGTLERLLSMPLAKVDLLLGYALAFGAVAVVQTVIVSMVAFALLDLNIEGPIVALVPLATLNALLGMAMGLFVSAFAATEFQAVQFMPAFLLPQFLLSGLLTPRSAMLRGLELLSDVLPMTYAYDALARVAAGDGLETRLGLDIGLLALGTVASLALGAATLRRRTA